MFCIYVFSVLAHSELAMYTWGLQYNKDTLQWPGGLQSSFKLRTSAMNCLHWNVGPFLNMENLQVFRDGGNLLWTLPLRTLNKWLHDV